jgi:methionyl-tRNA formyltransferase
MSDQPIRTVFMGTAGIAVPSLKALHADPRTEVLAVVSQPDRPKGRKLQLLPTDIHAAADSLGLPVLQPARCREPGFLEELRRLRPDVIAVMAHDRLAELGADLLADTLPRHIAGEISPQAQDHALATHARKISKEDGRLDWQRSATALWHQVRALTPWPGTWCHWHHAGRPSLLKVWKAAPVDAPNVIPGQVMKADREGLDIVCGEGALRLLEVQKEGGRRMSSPEFLAGNPLGVGDRLD